MTMQRHVSEGGFWRSLISIVLPITLQNFMYALVPVCDAMMLVALDQSSMSAVSLAGQAMFVLNIFIYGLSAGASMFAAQYWGKGDTKSIEKLFGYVMRITIPILLVFFCCAVILPEGVMRIFNGSDEIVAHGISYLRIVAFAYLFDGVAQIYAIILKNVGLVRQSTVISLVMVGLNIGLNAVFIYGLLGCPSLGCAGAALATTISCAVGFTGCVFVLYKKSSIRLRLSDVLHSDPEIRKDFSKYSTPMMLNQILWGIGFTMITVILGHMGDDDVVAANAIATAAKDLVSSFCFALAAGGSIIVGNELGANNLARGKEYGSKLCRLSIISGLIMGCLLAASTPAILHFADITPRAGHYLTVMLLTCTYYIMGRSVNSTVIGGIFISGGDTRFGMICDTLTMWAFIVPLGAVAAYVIHLPVLWVYFILNLDEMIKLPAVYIHYKKYKWVKNIVDK